ncbi:MAG: flagellar hook-associated protein FlgK [Acidobacteria bacterium]|nr:flagellar hook-associated protein FlgK [Acidobacteriota bacterium]
MGTVNSLMDLARQTLMADQAALGVISNNVANQNTPGYTRQVVNWQTRDSVTIGGYTVGEGVAVGPQGVSQRDRVLEQRVQQAIQTQSQSEALSSALNQVQNIFGLSSTSSSASSTALGSALNSFFGTLSSLTANPSDATTRQAVLSAAKGLADAFNSASNQISQVSRDLDKQAAGYVDRINALTSTIAALNKRIGSTSPGSDAGVLEDQRQQAIAQLSQYIGLNQITNEANGITLTTSNGAVLVSGDHSYAMSTTQISGVTHLVAGASSQDVTVGLTGGALGGILAARDQQIPAFQSALDNLAYSLGTKINQVNAQGLDGNGNPGQVIFALPASAGGAAGLIGLATTDPQAIAAAATGEGATGNSNALLLARVSGSSIVAGQTASGFFTSLLAQIGNAASGAATDNTAQQTILTQLTSQRNALSGVSLDEEAANLTNYQRAYQAAAKVFSIADEIMSSALNLGVNTSVS